MQTTDTDKADAQAYQGLQLQLIYVALALGCIIGSVSLALLAGTLFIRLRTRLNLQALPGRGITFLFAVLFLFGLFKSVLNGLGLTVGGQETEFFLKSGQIVYWLLRYLGNWAFFLVLYKLAHVSMGYCCGTTKSTSFIKIVHWVILGIVAAISIAEWGLWTDVMFKKYRMLNDESEANFWSYGLASMHWMRLVESGYVIRWVASFEIVVWMATAAIRTLRKREHFRVTTFFLFAAALFFFAQNMIWAIIMIRTQVSRHLSEATIEVTDIIESVFMLLTYVGIMPFCLRWGLIFQEQKALHDLETSAHNCTSSPPQPRIAEVHAKPVAFEADSHSYGDVNAAIHLAEADASRPIVEMDGSRAVYEADSGTCEEKLS